MAALFFLNTCVGQLANWFNTWSVLGWGSKRLLVMTVEAVLVHDKFPSLLRWGISGVSLTWFSNCSVNHNYLDGGLLPRPGDFLGFRMSLWGTGLHLPCAQCHPRNKYVKCDMASPWVPGQPNQCSGPQSSSKSLAQWTCTECLFHSWYGPRQGCRWPGPCGLKGGILESPDMPSPLWYVYPSRPGESLMSKGRCCVSLTWAVGTSPMKNGTLNLDRQVSFGPPHKWGRSALAEQVR